MQPDRSSGRLTTSGSERRGQRADRIVALWARHWLLMLNTLSGVFLTLPILAPWLAAHGHAQLASAIYLAYRLVCHQKPERSFFLFGHQMAFCQRDLAIYAGVFVLGLVYGLVRNWLRPLSWRGALLLALPMIVDGVTQLVGWRESTWELRLVTGLLFALATVWFVYPRLEAGFAEIRVIAETRAFGTRPVVHPAK